MCGPVRKNKYLEENYTNKKRLIQKIKEMK